MKHKMKLQPIYFDKIKNGEKIYEVRLNDEKRQLIKVGDVIEFTKEPENTQVLETKVEELLYFSTFLEMAKSLPLNKVGFEKQTPQEVEQIYYSFYSKEDECKYGIVAIKVKI